MIQEFSVANFLSYGTRQTISFEATSDKTCLDELSVEVKSGVRLLKMALIYGANASGKSNLLFAMEALWEMLFHYTHSSEVRLYKPFKPMEGEPSVFEVVFWADKIKYTYELSFSRTEVIHEKMQYAPNGVLSLFYERTGANIVYGSTLNVLKRDRDVISSSVRKNQTVLSVLQDKNLDNVQFNTIYDWIRRTVNEMNIYDKAVNIAEEAETDADLKHFMLRILRKADFNISDFQLIEVSPVQDEILSQIFADHEDMPDIVKNAIIDNLKKTLNNRKDVLFTHRTANANFNLPVGLESLGTIRYFLLSRLLYDLTQKESVSMIDEIGDHLHSDLLRHYLETYLRNSNSSQLIFTTHNQTLLDMDFVRRDMIWFADKSKDSSATELTCAADYGLHINMSIQNAYRIGKLGAKPLLGSTALPWTEDRNEDKR